MAHPNSDVQPSNARPARLSFGEREQLLREGKAWADVNGVWHYDAPAVEVIGAAIEAHCEDPYVQRSLRAAADAALAVGDLLRQLRAAEESASATHRQVHVEALAAMSRANLAPHDSAHDAALKKYFEISR